MRSDKDLFKLIGGFLLLEGFSAAFGATSGAIGSGVLRKGGWTGPDYQVDEFAAACAVASMVYTAAMSCCLTPLFSDEKEKAQAGGLIALLGIGVGGAIIGMLGSAMLGKTDGVEIGFSAAGGATGFGILTLGLTMFLGCCVMPCLAVASRESNLLENEQEQTTNNSIFKNFQLMTPHRLTKMITDRNENLEDGIKIEVVGEDKQEAGKVKAKNVTDALTIA